MREIKDKLIRFVFFLFPAFFLFYGCVKNPSASFTVNKQVFISGDVIHLKNTSTNATSYLWVTPNGKTYSSQDLDYTTDSSMMTQNLVFSLHIAGNDGMTPSTSKAIKVKQYIPPSDNFSLDGNTIIPTRVFINLFNNSWTLYADNDSISNGTITSSFASTISIYFPGNTPPLPGSYTLQSYSSYLSSGQACIRITNSNNFNGVYSSSGTATVTQSGNGKIRVVFNNIPAGYSSIISGDIISP